MRTTVFVSVALAAALLSGCQDDEADPISRETRSVTVDGDHVAFTIAVPEHWADDEQDTLTGDCGQFTQQLGELTVQAVPTSCRDAATDGNIGNGHHGTFRTLGDVPEPMSVQSIETALGPATLFTQEYYECTNSCERWHEAWVIVDLTDPVDPAYPTLSLRASDDLGLTDIQQIAETLEPAR